MMCLADLIGFFFGILENISTNFIWKNYRYQLPWWNSQRCLAHHCAVIEPMIVRTKIHFFSDPDRAYQQFLENIGIIIIKTIFLAATRTVPTSSFSTRSTCWNENLSGCQPPGCARSKPTVSTEQLLFLWNSISLRKPPSLLWNSLNWAVPPTEQLDKASTELFGPSLPLPVFPSQPEYYVRRPPMVTS